MPEKDWCDYFRDQFSAPNSYLDNTFCQALDKELHFAVKDIGVLVTASLMRSKIVRLKKKKKSKDIDGISGTHLSFARNLLLQHLSLLFQMIFVTGIVPDSFGVRLVHPILKKGKPADQCTSYLPITVSTTFCKLF